MLAFIKTNYKAGDTIEVNCSTGTFIGKIEHVNDHFIVLRQPNGKICGIAAKDVLSFTADQPNPLAEAETPTTLAPAYEVPAANELTNAPQPTATTSTQLGEEASTAPEATAEVTPNAEATPDAPATTETTAEEVTAEEVKAEENAPAKEEQQDIDFTPHLLENRPKIKVLGHIDLDKVDPNRKPIFKKKKKEAEPTATGTANEATNAKEAPAPTPTKKEAKPILVATAAPQPATHAETITTETKAPTPPAQPLTKVKGMGRVVVYNAEKKQGYIQDFNGNGNLHFMFRNVVDPSVVEPIERNTKLAYTIEEHGRGKEAVCLHAPMTFAQIMKLAEQHIDNNHLLTALRLANHILDANPDYIDAQAMAEDMRKGLAIQQHEESLRKKIHIPQKSNTYANFIQQAQPTEYALAKEALLNKRYDEAEQHYLRSIEKGEKADSCVKDVLTMLVSRYKKAETPELKQAIAQKAQTFLGSYQHYLPENLTSKQFIALNFLLPLEDYEHFLAAVDELIIDPQISESPARMGFYLWQKAITYNKLGMTNDALALIEEGLRLAPDSKHLVNLKNSICQSGATAATPNATSAATATATSNATATTAPTQTK